MLVEDDSRIAELVVLHLRDSGFQVERVSDGVTGLEKAQKKAYAIVVLDVMLPELDGLEVCKALRSAGQYVPILMLTAKSEEIDKLIGLELGADDYLTKPFSIRELVARVKALVRRDQQAAIHTRSSSKQNVIGELTIDSEKRRVTCCGKLIELTSKEFDLLAYLAAHPGRPFSRATLLNDVWGYNFEGYEHTVNSHVNRLRAKLEVDPNRPRYVLTVRGVGYRLAEADELERTTPCVSS